MSGITDKRLELDLEAIDNVPSLPAYASQALNRLAAELHRARAAEKRLREALNEVKGAVQDVET